MSWRTVEAISSLGDVGSVLRKWKEKKEKQTQQEQQKADWNKIMDMLQPRFEQAGLGQLTGILRKNPAYFYQLGPFLQNQFLKGVY